MEKRGQENPQDSGASFVRLIGAVLAPLFGSLSWTPPPWVKYFSEKLSACASYLRTQRRDHPYRFWGSYAAVLLLIAAAAAGYIWYQSLPKPVEFTVTGTSPEATKLEEDARPDPVHIYFSGSAAKLKDVGKPVTEGITITPRIKGEWRWVKDSQLTFTPKDDQGKTPSDSEGPRA
ncbi:MAG: hypothetical protein ACYSTI_14265 [Planctomycetota bacterium]|jgi:hypothetical protein